MIEKPTLAHAGDKHEQPDLKVSSAGFELPWWSIIMLPWAAILGTQMVGLTLRLLEFAPGANHPAYKLVLAMSQLVAWSVVAAFGLWLSQREPAKSVEPTVSLQRMLRGLFAQPTNVAVVGVAVLTGFALQFPLSRLSHLMLPWSSASLEDLQFRQQLVTYRTPAEAVATWFAFVVVAPLVEELLFRGVLLRGLQSRLGSTVTLVLTSVAFGVVHGALDAVVYATLAGLTFGRVMQKQGNLGVTMAMHAGVNAVPLVLQARWWLIPGFNEPLGPSGAQDIAEVLDSLEPLAPVVWVPATALAVAGIMFLVRNPTRPTRPLNSQ